MALGRAFVDRIVIFFINAVLCLRHPQLVGRFRARAGYFPNIALPGRLHEKFLWRKLFDHDPRLVQCCDKLAAKDLVAELCPEIRIPRTLWVGSDFDEIPNDVLRPPVVIKTNHGCKMNILVTDSGFDRDRARRDTRKWLRRRFGRKHLEWAYSAIAPRLFVEEMVLTDGRPAFEEYKIYVAGGVPIYTFVMIERHGADPKGGLLDAEGNTVNVEIDSFEECNDVAAPANYAEMLRMAAAIGSDFDFIRCDFYNCDGEIWFSELTPYSNAGYTWIRDKELMDGQSLHWDLRQAWFVRQRHPGMRGTYASLLRRLLERPENRFREEDPRLYRKFALRKRAM